MYVRELRSDLHTRKEGGDLRSLYEIYVLYRTHQQAEVIREAIELKNIPMISSGRTNLLQKREIKTAIAYLSMLNNLFNRTGNG